MKRLKKLHTRKKPIGNTLPSGFPCLGCSKNPEGKVLPSHCQCIQ